MHGALTCMSIPKMTMAKITFNSKLKVADTISTHSCGNLTLLKEIQANTRKTPNK